MAEKKIPTLVIQGNLEDLKKIEAMLSGNDNLTVNKGQLGPIDLSKLKKRMGGTTGGSCAPVGGMF